MLVHLPRRCPLGIEQVITSFMNLLLLQVRNWQNVILVLPCDFYLVFLWCTAMRAYWVNACTREVPGVRGCAPPGELTDKYYGGLITGALVLSTEFSVYLS